MNINKKFPVWALILLDIVLVAAIILPFAIFHHVGEMRGWWGEEDAQKNYDNVNTDPKPIGTNDWFLTTPEKTTPEETTPEETTPGETTPEPTETPTEEPTPMPTPTPTPTPVEVTPVALSGDAAIRAYAESAGLPLMSLENGVYTQFYRSANICVTLIEVTESAGRNSVHKYYVYDVYVRDVQNLYTVVDSQRDMHDLISEGEEYAGGTVIAAINGDYSSNKNHCRVVVRNGELYRNAGYYDSDLCVMYYDGTMETYDYRSFNFSSVEARNPYQIWDFGPALLDGNGKAKDSFDSSAYDRHILSGEHPRTAIGYYAPGHYCFVVVDGRQRDEQTGKEISGYTVKQLAALMEKLGCKCAYNLDGGDSSQAYMNGADIRIDTTRSTQRVLSDIICVGEIAALPGKED